MKDRDKGRWGGIANEGRKWGVGREVYLVMGAWEWRNEGTLDYIISFQFSCSFKKWERYIQNTYKIHTNIIHAKTNIYKENTQHTLYFFQLLLYHPNSHAVLRNGLDGGIQNGRIYTEEYGME